MDESWLYLFSLVGLVGFTTGCTFYMNNNLKSWNPIKKMILRIEVLRFFFKPVVLIL